MPLIVHAVDLGPYRERLDALGGDGMRQALRDIGAAARHEWWRLAQAELHTTLGPYSHGLQEPAETENGVAISLVGVIPNLIENGMAQVDLHTTLLGPKVPEVPRGQRGKHRSKSGNLYRSIPFRHQTPGTDGLVAPPMGTPLVRKLGIFGAKTAGDAIYRQAKQLSATTSGFSAAHAGAMVGAGRAPGAARAAMAGGGARFGFAHTTWGERLDRALAEKIAPAMSNPTTGKAHTTSIYAGMYRFEKTYEKAPQRTYGTFRTISDAPGSMGKWVRGATEGKHFARRVAQTLGPLAKQILVGLLRGGAP